MCLISSVSALNIRPALFIGIVQNSYTLPFHTGRNTPESKSPLFCDDLGDLGVRHLFKVQEALVQTLSQVIPVT